jgi:hypothetical protein
LISIFVPSIFHSRSTAVNTMLIRAKRSFVEKLLLGAQCTCGDDLPSFQAARVSAKAADLTLPRQRQLIKRPPCPCPKHNQSNNSNSSITTQTHPNNQTQAKASIIMPTMVQSTAYKSIYDTPEASNQTNTSSSSTQQQDPYTSTRKPDYDPEVSSVFTQSTLAPEPSSSASSSSRFGFLHRKKSQQQDAALLPNEAATDTKEKKKSRFENPFKPHVQTDEDRAIMERMRERLGSKEEAIKRGGAGPAGYKGVGGGQEMGMPWAGGMG